MMKLMSLKVLTTRKSPDVLPKPRLDRVMQAFSRSEVRSDKSSDREVVLCSSNFSTQSTSSSDAIITDTAVVADADK